MQLALIADTFPPLRTSGAVQLRDLSREFVRQGHRLTVMLPAPQLDGPWTLEHSDGVEVLRLKAPRTKDIGYLRRTLGELAMPYAMARQLRRSPLAARRWDGVVWYSPSIFHGPLVATLKRQSECKGYLILRDMFPEWAVDMGLMGRGMPYRFFRAIAKRQYDIADVIGVQSQASLLHFNEHYPNHGGKAEQLSNWLGPVAERPCSIRIEQTPLAGRKLFVYAGNMGVAQGMDTIIDLAERLCHRTDVGFVLVGRGSAARQLAEDARSRRLDNIMFFDEIDPDEIPGLYAQCEVGLILLDPRHTTHNLPGKFLTYLQNGLPILAGVNPGNDIISMVERERVGRACGSHSAELLTRLALELLAERERDPALPQRCRALFSRCFGVESTVQQIVQLFARLELG